MGYSDDADAAAAAAVERAGPVVRTIRVAATELCLTFAGPALLDAVLRPLEHLVVTPAGPPAASITVWDSTTTGAALPVPPWGPADLGAQGRVQRPNSVAVHDPGVSLAMLWEGGARGMWWAADAATLPWWERGAPMRTLLHWTLATDGRVLVHGAAVGLGGRGALLAGPSGSGKSTLALACLHAGFEFAGDDYVLVEPRADGFVAHALYATAKVTPGTSARWPELVAALDVVPPPDDEQVPALAGGAKAVAHVDPARMARTLVVDELVLPSVGPAAPLQPASQGEAVRALAPSSILQLPGYASGALRTIADLARRVPAVALLSDDPAASVAELRRLLERWASAS